MDMPWLEYNLHITKSNLNGVERIIDFRECTQNAIIHFIGPFIKKYKQLFQNWHYLIEPDDCGEAEGELRLRFKGSNTNLDLLRKKLVAELKEYVDKSGILMEDKGSSGSHEGCHGKRNNNYKGAKSETFGNDWPIIVGIMQMGSESAIKILELGVRLKEERSLQWGQRKVIHPYYLHLPDWPDLMLC